MRSRTLFLRLLCRRLFERFFPPRRRLARRPTANIGGPTSAANPHPSTSRLSSIARRRPNRADTSASILSPRPRGSLPNPTRSRSHRRSHRARHPSRARRPERRSFAAPDRHDREYERDVPRASTTTPRRRERRERCDECVRVGRTAVASRATRRRVTRQSPRPIVTL